MFEYGDNGEGLMDISQAWLALIAALLGGSGLKIVEYFINRPKAKQDAAAEIRSELRKEVDALRRELHGVENELDAWKAKYYELVEEFLRFKAEQRNK